MAIMRSNIVGISSAKLAMVNFVGVADEISHSCRISELAYLNA
jgi:hypothetical protein